MDNTIFYVIGDTPSTRLAVADAIAQMTDAKVIHAPDIYAPIFPLLASSKLADIPDAAWEQVDVVRGAILKTIETLSPRNWNFVFTHAGFDIPADVGVYRTIRDMAKRRGSRFQPARLTGGGSKRPLLTFDEANGIDLDAAMPPAEASKAIVITATGG
jgi:hypothetical protein